MYSSRAKNELKRIAKRRVIEDLEALER
jgi:hypothetical protein